jgi:tetratricopeptide (TPR) repeat protein
MRQFAILIASVVLLGSISAQEDDNRDTVIRDDGRPMYVYVGSEGLEELTYSVTENAASSQTLRYTEVSGVRYHGMGDGFWQRARQAQNADDNQTAADNYLRLYENALQEWERAYGLYGHGVMLETMGKHAEAIPIFRRFLEEMPEHRLVLNVLYRLGMNLVWADQSDESDQILERLKELSRGRMARRAENRMKAITALLYIVKDQFKEAERHARIRFSIDHDEAWVFGDKEIWQHWSMVWGKALEEAEEWRDAVRHYEGMLKPLGNDPAARATITLKLAELKLRDSNEDGALYDFLVLDAMPVGSPTARARARLFAASIMLKRADQAESDQQERMRDVAKVMLQAVASSEEADYAPKATKLLESL